MNVCMCTDASVYALPSLSSASYACIVACICFTTSETGVYIFASVFVCIHMCVHIYIYTYMHMHTQI